MGCCTRFVRQPFLSTPGEGGKGAFMIEKTEKFIRDHGLIRPGNTVISGLSGGPDSVCMTEILYRLQDRLSFRLAAVHVNHGIRGESAAADAAFSEAFSRERGIPFLLFTEDVPKRVEETGESEEEAARVLRYRALREAAEILAPGKEVRIAVAHHMDDQAETILFRLLRGSGLTGLSGMQPERDGIIRPLLPFRRDEILAWLRKEGLSWCEDETNSSTASSRNLIRKTVIPALTEVRSDAVEKITETGASLHEIETYLNSEADAWLLAPGNVACFPGKEPGQRGSREIVLSKEALRETPGVLRNMIVRRALQALGAGLRDFTRQHFSEIGALSEKGVGKRLDLPGGFLAVSEYDTVAIRQGKAPDIPGKIPFRLEMRTFSKPDSQKIKDFLKEKEYTKCFDYDKINESPVLRTRRSGDLFSTYPGTEKKLSDYMIDRKIPKEERDRVPLVADGQRILWIIGYRMSEAYKITENTETVLEITAVPEEETGENYYGR